MASLFDTHAHLDHDSFESDRDDVIRRAHEAGVVTMIAMGVDVASSQAAIALAGKNPGIYAAVGIQPNYCGQAQAADWDRVLELCVQPGVVAIGETGLDRYWDHSPFDVQQDYFDRHLRLAQERDLPFVVHTRECDADVLDMLRAARNHGELRGVMHSFTSTEETAGECVALGLHLSFAGMVTFTKSAELRRVAASLPADRILLESDSPYLSPHPLRGKRNEPANVVHTARVLAEARGVPLEDFAAQTTANARRLFRLC